MRIPLLPFVPLILKANGFRARVDRFAVAHQKMPSIFHAWPLEHPHVPLLLVERHFRRLGLTKRRDRKSTRLNSSHVAISYAVFCLKKKIVVKRYTTIVEDAATDSQSVNDRPHQTSIQ